MEVIVYASEQVNYKEVIKLEGEDLAWFIDIVAKAEEKTIDEIKAILETAEGRKYVFGTYAYELMDFFQYEPYESDYFEVNDVFVDGEKM